MFGPAYKLTFYKFLIIPLGTLLIMAQLGWAEMYVRLTEDNWRVPAYRTGYFDGF
jgi:hypothetical protein